jgi:hypothetical protein
MEKERRMIYLYESPPPGHWGKWVENRIKENPGKPTGIWYAIAWKKYNQGHDYVPPRKTKAKPGKPKAEPKKHGKMVKKRRAKPGWKAPPKAKPGKRKGRKKKLTEMTLAQLKAMI